MNKTIAPNPRNRFKYSATLLGLFLLSIFGGGSLRAQELTYGIDPARDSAAFAAFRMRMDSIRQTRPVVALVLSGGGAKGAAHIAVLKHLDSIGLRPDIVVGTSIGALVGGIYACGHSGAEMERIFLSQSWDTLIRDLHSSRYDNLEHKDFNARCQLALPFGKANSDFFSQRPGGGGIRRTLIGGGVVQGQNICNLLSSLIVSHADECDFLDLPIPFVCVASDMVSARAKVWHSGDLVTAMRSSMTIPGLFSPLKTNDMVLLDGSLRSNFPVEVARALGADTVIGVDISAPALQDYQMNTLLDIVFQTTDVLGRETYDAAVAGTDIYIRPDLREFSLLSFNEPDIRTMIHRGRTAVGKAATRLDNLKAATHSSPAQPAAGTTRPAADSIAIAKVSFVGIDAKGQHYLLHLLHLGNRVTISDVENAVDVMMGTQAFSTVTYRFLGQQPPYILQFTCRPASVSVVGVGVRFDSYEMGAILLEAGFNTHSLTGSRASIVGRLGQRSGIKAAYGFHTREGWNFGTSENLQYVRYGNFRIDAYDFQINHLHSRTELYLDIARLRQLTFRTGVLLDYWHRYSLLTDYTLPQTDWNSLDSDNTLPGFFAQMRSDTYDDPYFPSRGIRTDLLARFFFNPGQSDSTDKRRYFFTLSGDFGTAVSIGRVALLPYVSARYVSPSSIPYYMNALSVAPSSRILEQQIPFVGVGEATLCQRLVSSAGLTARVNVSGKHYVSLLMQALHQSDGLKSHFLADGSSSALGVGLEYAYRSPVGPLRLIVNWSTLSKKPGLLLNLGVDF